MGNPQNGWFIMNNPLKPMLPGYQNHFLGNLHMHMFSMLAKNSFGGSLNFLPPDWHVISQFIYPTSLVFLFPSFQIASPLQEICKIPKIRSLLAIWSNLKYKMFHVRIWRIPGSYMRLPFYPEVCCNIFSSTNSGINEHTNIYELRLQPGSSQ